MCITPWNVFGSNVNVPPSDTITNKNLYSGYTELKNPYFHDVSRRNHLRYINKYQYSVVEYFMEGELTQSNSTDLSHIERNCGNYPVARGRKYFCKE